MDMDLSYGFRILPPGQAVSISIEVKDTEGLILAAAFGGRQIALTDAALWRAWWTHPLMTLGVMAMIHWEALKIWLKGEQVRQRPSVPLDLVTVGRRSPT